MKRQRPVASEFAAALQGVGTVKRIALSRLVVGHAAEQLPASGHLNRAGRDKRWRLRPSLEAGRLLSALAMARPPCVAGDLGKDAVRVVFNSETVRILQAHIDVAEWSSVRIPCAVLDEAPASTPITSELIAEASALLAAANPEPTSRIPKKRLRQALGIHVVEDNRDVVRTLSADQSATRRSR